MSKVLDLAERIGREIEFMVPGVIVEGSVIEEETTAMVVIHLQNRAGQRISIGYFELTETGEIVPGSKCGALDMFGLNDVVKNAVRSQQRTSPWPVLPRTEEVRS